MANKSFQGLFSPLEVVSTSNLLKIQQDQCKISMSRIYYSNVFKIYYISLIITLSFIIFLLLLHLKYTERLIFIVEVIITSLLCLEVLYRAFMQGWGFYFKQIWNIFDLIVIIGSITLLWIGVKMGEGLGEIDDISASLVVIVRCGVQGFRLYLVLKKKGEQEIQIIDLNGISEGDDARQHTDKNFRPQKQGPNNLRTKKKKLDVSADESR